MLSLLRALLVKQSYHISFVDKLILNEPDFRGLLLVSSKSLQHGANRGLAYSNVYAFYLTPFDVTRMVEAFTRGVKGLLFI